ncbi:hypothetical protein E3N88_40548 [Mikania micrantha]|uniref:Uncharacterized protein n=1 Tax=Mikania micrantha TaxID=192012 RepID=A0A5N6LNU1_9ASTR|nr:hypothetical protein E3N88_40548 [Mikania micrantha]
MLGLTCISVNRAPIMSSLSDRSNPDSKHQVRRINTATPPQLPSVPIGKQQKEKKPSVAEIERAIGAGIYKDRDINRRVSLSNHAITKQHQLASSVTKLMVTLRPSVMLHVVVTNTSNFAGKVLLMLESEQEKTLFDQILSNSIGRTEGDVEKKLRETGEWIIDQTEGPTRSTGKNILKVVFLWILPVWILSFLVASGVIKLPFISPFLDDLIM